MIEEKKLFMFEKMPIKNVVWKLSIPMILGSLVSVVYNLVDAYFVGMVNDPVQNAAITVSGPLLLAFVAISNLFGVGSSSAMSRAMGIKDYKKVKQSSAIGFYGALTLAALYALICFVFATPILNSLGAVGETYEKTYGYVTWTVFLGAVPAIMNQVLGNLVRAEGGALHSSIGVASGCVINMILDPIFILPWGLDLGCVGAGMSTCIANIFACGYLLSYLYIKRKTTLVSINYTNVVFDKKTITNILSVGIPASIQNLLNVTSMVVLNKFTVSYGNDAVAAMGIANKVCYVPVQIAMGFSQGIMPLIGYNYAAKNFKRMKEAIKYTLKTVTPILMMVALAFILQAEFIMSVFIKNANVIYYGKFFIYGFALAIPFTCIDFTTVVIFQALGKGKLSLIFAILRKIIIEIPAIIILNKLFMVRGIPYSHFVAEFMLAVAAAVILTRMFNKLKER